ncbi:MAG: hypothetical protein ABIQ35_02615 [Verrucomicrobiota bacterium]
MIATLNCPAASLRWSRLRALQFGATPGRFIRSLLFLAALASAIPGRAESSIATNQLSISGRARQRFFEAQTELRAHPEIDEVAIKFARNAFDWADFSSDNHSREEIALQGIEACRALIERRPKSAAGHYYLALNLGQLAQTKSLGALKLVSEMEKEFQIARGLDEDLDFAGPDRGLGLLYSEAPGWPTSIGSRSKARNHLQRAVLLKPNYPENRLTLLEAYLKWSDQTGSSHEFQALKELWPDAKKEFSGEQWESSWVDWNKRWGKIQARLPIDKILESPRSKK